MSEPPADLVLALLRAIRQDIAELRADVAEVEARLAILEGHGAHLSRRLDGLEAKPKPRAEA